MSGNEEQIEEREEKGRRKEKRREEGKRRERKEGNQPLEVPKFNFKIH